MGTSAKLIVTLGEKGYQIVTKNSERAYPCIKVTAVDTTAAGDTMSGAMLAFLSRGMGLEEAAALGSKAASIACTKKGAQCAIPTKEEVDNYPQ